MAFMDDISKKNKLNSQINEKEREINKLFAQIGQQYYVLHKENAEPELAAMVKAVGEAREVIQRNQERLDFANGVTQCPQCGKKVELSAQFCNGCGSRVPAPRRIIPTPEGNICIQCGAILQDGQKFCVGCGTRLVEEPVVAAPVQPAPVAAPPAPVVEAPPVAEAPSAQPTKTCAKCGAAMGDDQLFCVMCGAKAEAPAPVAAPAGKTCVKCGAAVEEGQAFCVMCGTKVQENVAAPKLCANCGKELLEGAAFCVGCGRRI